MPPSPRRDLESDQKTSGNSREDVPGNPETLCNSGSLGEGTVGRIGSARVLADVAINIAGKRLR